MLKLSLQFFAKNTSLPSESTKVELPNAPSEPIGKPWLNPDGAKNILNAVKNESTGVNDKTGLPVYKRSDMYRQLVPDATPNNLIDVGNPIIKYENVANEFLDVLINRIGFTWVHAKSFYNKLRPLKKGGIALGDTVQEIGVNPATASMYELCTDNSANDFFKCCKPDVKAAYHRLNRVDKYCVTISQDMLKNAFTSWDAFGRFVDSLIMTIYNGDEIDEFKLAKGLFNTAYNSGNVYQVEIDPITDQATAENLVRLIRYYITVLTEPSTQYNSWAFLDQNGTGYNTWVNGPQDLVLVINATAASFIDVNVLAAAFNLDKVDYLTNRIELADFGPGGENIVAVLCDKAWPQIWDVNKKVTSFYNPGEVSWKFWLHHWQIYSHSPFSNAIFFVTEVKTPVTPPDNVLVSNISLSGITLNPVFDPETLTYTASSTSATTTINVSSNAIPIIIFNNTNVSNGSQVTLNEGVNVFNIAASDGENSINYSINVTYTTA